MAASPASCLLVSDFNLQNLAGILGNSAAGGAFTPRLAPYGQVIPTLMSDDLGCGDELPGILFVWARPEAVMEPFARLLRNEPVGTDELLKEIDAFAAYLAKAAAKVRHLFVASWHVPEASRCFNLLQWQAGAGIADAVARMNIRLSEALAGMGNAYLLDTGQWFEGTRDGGCNAKLWHMAKIPYGKEVFQNCRDTLRSAADALYGRTRKLVVVDLDNTMWGGVLGDAGRDNLVLGGHDFRGEAFVEFQEGLKALTRRGILLAIASKNDEANALDAVDNHPEMVLRRRDFVGWRINWNDKAANIADLADELNLGLHSVVFIDDNPVERDRVRSALPEVLVPEWPAEPVAYPGALRTLDCFNAAAVTEEDAHRTGMYRSRRERAVSMDASTSMEQWIGTLDTVVTAEPMGPDNITRIVQLMNKTNQMNLTTRRTTEDELTAWAAGPGRTVTAFRVTDKFGDSGLTGILGTEAVDGRFEITDFVLSCRVMGRRIEETMLYAAGLRAGQNGSAVVTAHYAETGKNRPCLELMRRNAVSGPDADGMFTFPAVAAGTAPPGGITFMEREDA